MSQYNGRLNAFETQAFQNIFLDSAKRMTSYVDELVSIARSLEQENERLKQNCVDCNYPEDEANRVIGELRAENERLRVDNDAYREQWEPLQEQVRRLRLENKSAKDALSAIEAQVSRLHEENDRLHEGWRKGEIYRG